MNDLSSLLPGFLRQLHFSQELTGELVVALWEKTVGETLAQNARPLRMQGTTLVLTVSSEAWKKELFSLRFEILKTTGKAVRTFESLSSGSACRSLDELGSHFSYAGARATRRGTSRPAARFDFRPGTQP